jgi:hypothetical protein
VAIGEWSEPRPIPDYGDNSAAPFLVADRNRTVHAFTMGSSADGDFAIIYRRWSLAQGWSFPVDVILAGFLGIAPDLHGAFLDQAGMIHLIYSAGTQTSVGIYHTMAPVSDADQARAWSEPELIGVDATGVAAAITGDPDGRLVVVYAGAHRANGLYSVSSFDGGPTWSNPTLISPSVAPDVWPGSVWLEVDDTKTVHAVWHTANELGQGEEIRYARLDPDTGTWNPDIVLASVDAEQELIGWPSIIASGQELLVVYQDGFPPTRWVIRSSDGGTTWSLPVRPFPHTGGYQQAYPLVDSGGTVYLVLGNRLQNPEIHGMWYSRLVGSQWEPLEPVISGPATQTFDPCCPEAVVSQGNVLLATWTNNVRLEGRTGAWFSYTFLGSRELPVEAPSFPIEATVTSPPPAPGEIQGGAIGGSTPVPFGSAGSDAAAPPGAPNPGLPILVGVVPAALLGVALWAHRRRGLR